MRGWRRLTIVICLLSVVILSDSLTVCDNGSLDGSCSQNKREVKKETKTEGTNAASDATEVNLENSLKELVKEADTNETTVQANINAANDKSSSKEKQSPKLVQVTPADENVNSKTSVSKEPNNKTEKDTTVKPVNTVNEKEDWGNINTLLKQIKKISKDVNNSPGASNITDDVNVDALIKSTKVVTTEVSTKQGKKDDQNISVSSTNDVSRNNTSKLKVPVSGAVPANPDKQQGKVKPANTDSDHRNVSGVTHDNKIPENNSRGEVDSENINNKLETLKDALDSSKITDKSKPKVDEITNAVQRIKLPMIPGHGIDNGNIPWRRDYETNRNKIPWNPVDEIDRNEIPWSPDDELDDSNTEYDDYGLDDSDGNEIPLNPNDATNSRSEIPWRRDYETNSRNKIHWNPDDEIDSRNEMPWSPDDATNGRSEIPWRRDYETNSRNKKHWNPDDEIDRRNEIPWSPDDELDDSNTEYDDYGLDDSNIGSSYVPADTDYITDGLDNYSDVGEEAGFSGDPDDVQMDKIEYSSINTGRDGLNGADTYYDNDGTGGDELDYYDTFDEPEGEGRERRGRSTEGQMAQQPNSYYSDVYKSLNQEPYGNEQYNPVRNNNPISQQRANGENIYNGFQTEQNSNSQPLQQRYNNLLERLENMGIYDDQESTVSRDAQSGPNNNLYPKSVRPQTPAPVAASNTLNNNTLNSTSSNLKTPPTNSSTKVKQPPQKGSTTPKPKQSTAPSKHTTAAVKPTTPPQKPNISPTTSAMLKKEKGEPGNVQPKYQQSLLPRTRDNLLGRGVTSQIKSKNPWSSVVSEGDEPIEFEEGLTNLEETKGQFQTGTGKQTPYEERARQSELGTPTRMRDQTRWPVHDGQDRLNPSGWRTKTGTKTRKQGIPHESDLNTSNYFNRKPNYNRPQGNVDSNTMQGSRGTDFRQASQQGMNVNPYSQQKAMVNTVPLQGKSVGQDKTRQQTPSTVPDPFSMMKHTKSYKNTGNQYDRNQVISNSRRPDISTRPKSALETGRNTNLRPDGPVSTVNEHIKHIMDVVISVDGKLFTKKLITEPDRKMSYLTVKVTRDKKPIVDAIYNIPN